MAASTPPIELDVYMDEQDLLRELRSDVVHGLQARPRWLSPRWFYDELGSRLFDEITRLPEYYLTRAETEILQQQAPHIAELVGPSVLIELGSGFSTKTRLLLDALHARDHLRGVVTVDVSPEALEQAAMQLAARYPGVPMHPIVGDYGRHLDAVPRPPERARRLLVFLGSTIGNLIPQERRSFLAACARMLEPGEHFLVGTDLVKDPSVLEAAYDDSAGVTARFNRNVLDVIRRRLGGQIDVDAFEHAAWWSEDDSWVQVALRATRPTVIDIPGLVRAELTAGEQILTEVSTKFTPSGIDAELAAAGLRTVERWTDSGGRFALTLAERTES